MPRRLTLFFDYHCPYCYRLERWVTETLSRRLAVEHRFLSLEQLNRDPEASSWRIWEQPLDYEHHRGRPERRSLAAFLVTALAEDSAPETTRDELAARLRTAIFAARHEEGLDISDPAVLDRIAAAVGFPPGWAVRRLADSSAVAAARARIAADWAVSRSPFRLFGVPTLILDEAPPLYLRLARPPTPEEGERLLEWLAARTAELPFVLELKLPEAAPEPSSAGPRPEPGAPRAHSEPHSRTSTG